MTTIKTLLPKASNLKVVKVDLLHETLGAYDKAQDIVLIDRSFRKDFPRQSILVLMHEIFHSTMAKHRTNRIQRLVDNFGEFNKGSVSHAVEEVIAEIAAMILAKKLGTFSLIDRSVFEFGINKYKDKVPFIPWREVVAAVYHYSEDTSQFDRELNFIKNYVRYKFSLTIQDNYDS